MKTTIVKSMQASKLICVILMCAGFSLFTLSALGQDQKTEFSLETITCWEVMLLEEEERAYAFVLIYGYHSGKSNQATISGEKIETSISRGFSFCENNPDNPAIDAMSLVQD